MIVWLRLLITFIKSLFKEPIRDLQNVLSGQHSVSFRVWLTECEGSIMNNARYCTFGEACRLDLMSRTGHLKYLLKNKIQTVVASQYIRYLKPLKRFQKIEVSTQLFFWDERYFYFKHVFTRAGKEMAVIYVKVIGIKKGGSVKPQEILEARGFQISSPAPSSLIQKWGEFEGTLRD